MTTQAQRRHVITVPEVFHYTGVNVHSETFTFARLTGVSARGGRYVVLFEWDYEAKYLDLLVSPAAGSQATVHTDPREAGQLLMACGVPRDSLPKYLRPEGEMRPSRRFLVADVGSDSSVQVTVRIDT